MDPTETLPEQPPAAIEAPDISPDLATVPKTVAVVAVDISKTRELTIRVECDKIVPKRYLVKIELTISGGRKGGGRSTLGARDFTVNAQSFEAVYDALPGLIRAATR